MFPNLKHDLGRDIGWTLAKPENNQNQLPKTVTGQQDCVIVSSTVCSNGNTHVIYVSIKAKLA